MHAQVAPSPEVGPRTAPNLARRRASATLHDPRHIELSTSLKRTTDRVLSVQEWRHHIRIRPPQPRHDVCSQPCSQISQQRSPAPNLAPQQTQQRRALSPHSSVPLTSLDGKPTGSPTERRIGLPFAPARRPSRPSPRRPQPPARGGPIDGRAPGAPSASGAFNDLASQGRPRFAPLPPPMTRGDQHQRPRAMAAPAARRRPPNVQAKAGNLRTRSVFEAKETPPFLRPPTHQPVSTEQGNSLPLQEKPATPQACTASKAVNLPGIGPRNPVTVFPPHSRPLRTPVPTRRMPKYPASNIGLPHLADPAGRACPPHLPRTCSVQVSRVCTNKSVTVAAGRDGRDPRGGKEPQ